MLSVPGVNTTKQMFKVTERQILFLHETACHTCFSNLKIVTQNSKHKDVYKST